MGFEESEFAQFVAACAIDLGVPEPPKAPVSTSLDARHYFEQFQNLHKEISTWLTNHSESDEIPREYLFAAIGFRQSRSDLLQQFPPPQIPYEHNSAASQRLKVLIGSTSGGYLAATRPAGIGKSTLVENVLQDYALFVPYYAYLPSGQVNPRDRGQSLVFFQDVVLRLDIRRMLVDYGYSLRHLSREPPVVLRTRSPKIGSSDTSRLARFAVCI